MLVAFVAEAVDALRLRPLGLGLLMASLMMRFRAASTPIPQPPGQLRSAVSAPPRQRRPPELKIDPPRADLRRSTEHDAAAAARDAKRQSSLVEIGDGWARCARRGRAYSGATARTT